MTLIPADLRLALNVNGHASRIQRARERAFDPWPVVKFFNPIGAATWLATEIDSDGDTLFGLADLGFGCPELGCFSLAEIAAVRLPFGLAIQRDACFDPLGPLSDWTETARRLGSIRLAEKALLRRKLDRLLPDPPPGADRPGGGAGS
ncbi:DUF2958 domain-containing protein [Sphingopyxis terrae]|uniref:DUF2958 domain-containing protein n=1 Tax=Sphingopyxis terrae subsp. ummariensis TaxID=429001 RepID=A0A1Y6FV34_9SPHN|nr:DUF2958 domain-containing protein [Sphingopyxis terrae]PCF90979.1 DUF2958 domain-containing protein [Sphingopyxis terrae subsp. ummariensis]SMQ76403.1 Protein of unknown function [Sphingopyxis terrae subsp. ummariensis]